MNVGLADRYVSADSPVHRLDPRVKVGVTILFIVSNIVLPDGAWVAFLVAWGVAVAVSVLAGLGPLYAATRSLVALPFALAAISLVFTMRGAPAFTLAIGPWVLTATDAGLLRFASILVRSWLSVQAAILLSATTSVPDLLHALRHLKLPPLLVAVIGLMYRYLFILADEAGRLLRAREARSARPIAGRGGGSVAWRAQVAGHLAGQLFLRGYERSDRVYSAMLARGYAGELRTLDEHAMRTRDWIALAVAGLALAAVQVVGFLAR